jgi:hypothetical protein
VGEQGVFAAHDTEEDRMKNRIASLLPSLLIVTALFAPLPVGSQVAAAGSSLTTADQALVSGLNCQPDSSSHWSLTGSFLGSELQITGVALLRDGRVLAVSRENGFTQIYDPATGVWSATGSASPGRFGLNLVTLHDGRVLLAGGSDPIMNDLSTAELYDPNTGQWSFTGSMNTPRRGAVLTLLDDGRVLAAAGRHGPPDGSSFLASAEIYDPVTGTWSYTGSLATAREGAGAIRLLDGRIMLYGGEGPWFVVGKTTEVYDPATGLWSRVGDMSVGRMRSTATILLPDGRVLVTGGGPVSTATVAELFNPATGTWTPTGSLHVARVVASGEILPDGKVLVAGGYNLTSGIVNVLGSSEIYDPATGAWTLGDNMQVARADFKAVRLLDGRILAFGGWVSQPPTIWVNASEIYAPDSSPGTCPAEIALEPASASLLIGQEHTVTATVTDAQANPQSGVQVSLRVEAGPNIGANSTCSPNADCTTDVNGQVRFDYTGVGGPGTDKIKACFTTQTSQVICSQEATVEWTAQAPVIDYFALGDSIASGHGLMDDGSICHRSEQAYPYQVKEFLETRYEQVNFFSLACSGATAGAPSGQQWKSNPLKWFRIQVDAVLKELSDPNRPMDQPALISISIGMDDLGWADPMSMAIIFRLSDKDFLSRTRNMTEKIQADIQKEIARFSDKPNVSIVLTTYHNPVNRDSVFFSLLGGHCGIRPIDQFSCYARTEIAIHDLNTALKDLEQPGRIEVTHSLHEDFHDHAAPHRADSPENSCGNAPPEATESWVQYPGESNINSEIPPQVRKKLGFTEPFGDCFHPNYKGALAYANAVYQEAIVLLGH